MIKTFHELCAEVVRSCPNDYAKAYAQAGLLQCPDARDTDLSIPSSVRWQAAYILSNAGYWRGGLARDIKRQLQRYSRH